MDNDNNNDDEFPDGGGDLPGDDVVDDDLLFAERLSPLIQAILDGEPLDVIEGILQQSPDSIQQPYNGRYPLSYAVSEGSSVEVVKALFFCWPEAVYTKSFIVTFMVVGVRDGEEGWLPLHYVCEDTPVEVVEFLVDMNRASVYHRNADGDLPIHTMIGVAGRDHVRVLVEQYPQSLLKENQRGYLPIHEAIVQGDFELVEYLARQCPKSLDVPTGDKFKELPMHLAAKGEGEHAAEMVALVFQLRPATILSTTADGRLPLHVSLLSRTGASMGAIQRLTFESLSEEARLDFMHSMVRFAMKYPCLFYLFEQRLLDCVSAVAELLPDNQTLRATDPEGSLPIHVAVLLTTRNTGSSLAKHLVSIDPESPFLRNPAGYIPLHLALSREHQATGLSNFLFEVAPQTALELGSDGYLPIFSAMAAGRFRLVENIADRCPRGSQGFDARGRTPLHVAATHNLWCGNLMVSFAAEDLVRSWPESLLIRDADGNLPIHIVASRCRPDDYDEDGAAFARWDGYAHVHLVRSMIESSPESIRLPDAQGRVPLHLAVSSTDPPTRLVKLLVERWDEALDVRDASGNTPLLLAIANPTASLDFLYDLVKLKPDGLRSQLS